MAEEKQEEKAQTNHCNICVLIWMISILDAQPFNTSSLTLEGHISCDQSVTGYIDTNQSLWYSFTLQQNQTVRFTDCKSDFDPLLYVQNSNNEWISQPYCNGNDCNAEECSNSNTETFIIPSLKSDTYYIIIQPYDQGGNYEIQALCADNINKVFYPNITPSTNIDCHQSGDLGPNDICYIDCNLISPTIGLIYCGTAETCIIDCNSEQCLQSATIDASETDNLLVTANGKECMANSQIWLPYLGNANIMANSMGITANKDIFRDLVMYADHTDSLLISCVDSSNLVPNYQCAGLKVWADSVQYLHITVNGAGMQNSIIECPVNQSYEQSATCIINATNAYSTEDMYIITEEGIPKDVVFFADSNNGGIYINTVIECNGNETAIIEGDEFKNNSNCWTANLEKPTTTVEHTTAEPITPEPTTSNATSGRPTTTEPTTSEPTTPEPTTSNPTSEATTTVQPTTTEPTTSEPTTAEPTTTEPTTSEPTTTEPTTSEPTTADPTTADPTTAELTTSEPITTEFTASKAMTAEPIVESSIVASATTNVTLNIDTSASRTVNQYKNIGYIVIGIGIVILLIVTISALVYHKLNGDGVDKPRYTSIFKFLQHIIDLVTDILLFFELLIEQHRLALYSAIFSFGPHIISNIIGIFYVIKWKQQKQKYHIVDYITKYDRFFITMSVLSGFYSAVQITNSKLFHLKRLSMQLSHKQMAVVYNLHLVNDIILESIPSLCIQIAYISSFSSITDISGLAIISMIFSILSMLNGLFTLMSRVCNILVEKINNDKLPSLHRKITLKSSELKSKHCFAHQLISVSFAKTFIMHDYKIETVYINQIVDGIECELKFKQETTSIDSIKRNLSDLQDKNSVVYNLLISELCSNLKLQNQKMLQMYIEMEDNHNYDNIKREIEMNTVKKSNIENNDENLEENDGNQILNENDEKTEEYVTSSVKLDDYH